MTLNTDALENPLYNPDYVGLTIDIYKYYLPIQQADIIDLQLMFNDYTRINKYEGVIYNPRLSEIDKAESLIQYMRQDVDELDKVLHKYYFETDFSCNPEVTKPCGCPNSEMTYDDTTRKCTGPIYDNPSKTYTYDTVVSVSVTGSAWHSMLNQNGIWVSKDGSTPFQMTDTYVSFITKITVPVAGNYQIEGGADTLGKFFLNGVLTLSTTVATSWSSQQVKLQPGIVYVEARVQNNSLSQSAETWAANPGGVGFRIIGPDGSVILTSRSSSVKAVPFLCADGTISNLDKNLCMHYGTIDCVILDPVPNPRLDDWNYWETMKATLRLPFQSELDLVMNVCEQFKDWTNMQTANWTNLTGLAQHDMGMREKFQGIDNPCDQMQNYLGSLKQEGQDLMTQLINILLGFGQYIKQIEELVVLATNGYHAPDATTPTCQKIDFTASGQWSLSSGILFYNGQQAKPADLTNGTLQFTDGVTTWDAQKYLAANPSVQEQLNKGLPLFPGAAEKNPLKSPTHIKAVNVGNGYGIWVSDDGDSPVYQEALDKWVSLVWTINVIASGTYTIKVASKDKMNVYIDDFTTAVIQSTSTTISSVTANLTVGSHNVYIEGWHNKPPVLSDSVNDPAYMQTVIYDPSGAIFWNTRTSDPLICLCDNGYSPNPTTLKCSQGGAWTAEDHFIQIGAGKGSCVTPPCPYLLPESVLIPIFKEMQAASGDKLLAVLKAITDRMANELNNLIKAVINLDRLSVANMINSLPDDPCGKQFIPQVLQPTIAGLLASKDALRNEIIPNKPDDQLIPINAAPPWNE